MIWLPPWLNADGRPSTKSAMFKPPFALVVPLVMRPENVAVPLDWKVPSPSECGRTYDPPKAIAAGDKLGTFHMGSSVVVLLEPGRVNLEHVRLHAGKKVHYGAAVLHGEKFPG